MTSLTASERHASQKSKFQDIYLRPVIIFILGSRLFVLVGIWLSIVFAVYELPIFLGAYQVSAHTVSVMYRGKLL